MIDKITLRQIRNNRNLKDSLFESLYHDLLLKRRISEQGFEKLLKIALVFMNAGDDDVQELGYRIIVLYSITTKDYHPLSEIARTKEYMPIVEMLDVPKFLGDSVENKNVIEIIDDAYRSMFRHNGIVLSKGQVKIRHDAEKLENVVVVAPTSYGKSELLIYRAVKGVEFGNTCIVVPTKALIAQTFQKVMEHLSKVQVGCKVITHPDAYSVDTKFIAVLTQERLLRLLVENPHLSFQEILIDEAHNIFSGSHRSILLSSTILVAKSRNRSLRVSYFTPFLENPEQLRHINYVDEAAEPVFTREHLKTERYYYGEPGGRLNIYDQYLNKHIGTKVRIKQSAEDVVAMFSKKRTLVYLNRPRDVEFFSRKLSSGESFNRTNRRLEKIANALADFIHPEFSLVRCVRKGIFFHHGKLPDGVRQYIENVFQDNDITSRLIIVSTSTLLEGVNISPDALIILDPRRGRRNLSRSDFKNLVGRVSRFGSIFDKEFPRPELLSPKIFVIDSEYAPSSFNLSKFVQDRANIALSSAENVANPLLQDFSGSRASALEVVENIENGASGYREVRLAATEIGRLSFKHGVSEFDIFEHESEMQSVASALLQSGKIIDSANACLDVLDKVFFSVCTFDEGERALSRLSGNPKALKYHAMQLEWKVSGFPLKTLISKTVAYWRKQAGLVYVSPSWGDVAKESDDFAESYILPSKKTTAELVDLAVVRLKEEREFISFKLCKFVEVLYDFGLVEQKFLLQVRFGTSDPESIVLMRNGVSPELVRILLDGRFRKFIAINPERNDFSIDPSLLDEPSIRAINDILWTELQSLVEFS